VAKLVLLEHSLIDTGGHHFEYVRLLAQAARQHGRRVIVAAHRRFRAAAALGEGVEVIRAFRQTAYSRFSVLAGVRQLLRPSKYPFLGLTADFPNAIGRRSIWDRWRQRRFRAARVTWINEFATDCRRVLDQLELDECDDVLVATASELELTGLALYLAGTPRTLLTNWHLQFHFGVAVGRPPEHDEDARPWAAARHAFSAALARIPYHRLSLYATTAELAQQFNRLGVRAVHPLPYPVDRQFCPRRVAAGGQDDEPLRLTCAGGVRREKGQKSHLETLATAIASTHLATGRVRLVVQAGSPNTTRRLCRKLKLADSAIEQQRHPLPAAEYRQLIERAAAGLFFYDSRRYYGRRAGILGEFLAAGRPVIVPAGSWLGDQLIDAITDHVDEMTTEYRVADPTFLADMTWDSRNVPLARGVVSFDQWRNPFTCEAAVPGSDPRAAVRRAVVSFVWQWPREPGTYCRVELDQRDASGLPVGRPQVQILGHRSAGGPVAAMFRIAEGVQRVGLRLTNAYADQAAGVGDLQLDWLGAAVPCAAVGIAVAERVHWADAVAELVEHYAHYQTTARLFADPWRAAHDPRRTFHTLVQRRLDGSAEAEAA